MVLRHSTGRPGREGIGTKQLSDGTLDAVLGKIRDGDTLGDEDWHALTETRELIPLGVAADDTRRRRHGDTVTFVRVLEVPVAEIVADLWEPGSDAGESWPGSATEIRVTGCPTSRDEALAAVRPLVECAGRVPVTAFAGQDLLTLCDGDVVAFREFLTELRDAGVALVSELAVDLLMEPALVFKAFGMSEVGVARLTRQSSEGTDPVAVPRRVASWSDAGEVCRSFAPLPCAESIPPSTGYTDLRQVALARLLVDNIDSIQVDWSRYGQKLAQVALTFGANDVDAVSVAGAGEHGWRRSPLEEIRRNIAAAGFEAVPRNGRFERLLA